MKSFKRGISILLSVLMVLTLMPSMAFADTGISTIADQVVDLASAESESVKPGGSIPLKGSDGNNHAWSSSDESTATVVGGGKK